MIETAKKNQRVFKTAWFSKAAKKARIKDDELCEAIEQVMKGQADDLCGGVFKKRLNKNRHRSIVVAKGRQNWVYVYLFAKKDRGNIENDELAAFRDLANLYAKKTASEIEKELQSEELQELCP
jgi:hypothetical protein